MATSKLSKFSKQSKNQFNHSVNYEEEDEFFNFMMIDSDYYIINRFNKLKPGKTSSFGVAHVYIASLDAPTDVSDDLRTVHSRLKFIFNVF